MTSHHTNPSKPRSSASGAKPIWAHAPYNFVPLSDHVFTVDTPPSHDTYLPDPSHPEKLTGWIDCELETLSPTYIRGMLTAHKFTELEDSSLEKSTHAPFFASDGRLAEGKFAPVIPGSTLRGMTRALIEILSYGRIRWVGKTPTFTFRAVASKQDDPLAIPYRNVMGKIEDPKVCAGYLHRTKDTWEILPALKPSSQTYAQSEKNAYLKVKDSVIEKKDLPGFLGLNDAGYQPQIRQINFRASPSWDTKGNKRVIIDKVWEQNSADAHSGVLVTSGNMKESGKSDRKSLITRGSKERYPQSSKGRSNHAILLPIDPDEQPKPIPPHVIDDYLNGLTPFQEENLTAWSKGQGCLADGAPVFYILEKGQVVCFGHCPNFRIPARQKRGNILRAATPYDLIPQSHLIENMSDMSDAIFGWVEDPDHIGPTGQRAGRVFFENAIYENAREGVWYKPNPIALHILSTPKPTTFQHYLVQDKTKGHQPNLKPSLAHYGSDKEKTTLRGHKLYWRQGANPSIEASQKERQHDTQLTEVIPLKPGVKFRFKVHFENLNKAELGALCWALQLPSAQKDLCHHIGMGKSLGMGAVKITPSLHLTNRVERYSKLFDNNEWNLPEDPAEMGIYLKSFERLILDFAAPYRQKLSQLNRIRQLETMLKWRETTPEWLEQTCYMEIEHEDRGNEYRDRPVLPTPQGVIALMNNHNPTPDYELPGWIEYATVKEIDSTTGSLILQFDGISTSDMFGVVPAKYIENIFYKPNDLATFCAVKFTTIHGNPAVICRPYKPVGYQLGYIARVEGGTKTKPLQIFVNPEDKNAVEIAVTAKCCQDIRPWGKVGQRVTFKAQEARAGISFAESVELVQPINPSP